MHKQGKVVRWDVDRGFGFIRSPDTTADVFFHIRDFRGPGAPGEGLAVSYQEIHVGGKGPRAMAVQAVAARKDTSGRRPVPVVRRPAQSGKPDPMMPWVLLLAVACAALLVWAVWMRRLPVPILLAGPLVNALTFWFYWRDKHAAQKGAWRTPENTLHGLSLIGGWPSARIAQQVLRHKSAKASFQQVYWLTVVVNIAVLVAMAWPGQLPLSFLR